MGCPNWQESDSDQLTIQVLENQNFISGHGVIMVAHVGCGTWKKRLYDTHGYTANLPASWIRCYTDEYSVIKEARFCISDSQSWESLPLSSSYDATTDVHNVLDTEILLLSQCCGSLCKYLMVASGRASLFILRTRADRIIKVTDWRGSQIDLAADQFERRVLLPTDGILVTNGGLHDKILGIISSTSSIV